MPTAKRKIDDYLARKLWDIDLDSVSALKSWWIKFLRFLYILLMELSEEQLALRAMGLVYISLLSLVPLLAVSFSALKAFGVHTKFEILLYYFLEPLGEKGVDLSLKIIGFVENINVSVLGTVGLAMLIYTVISQIQKVESALNYIWDIKGTRSFEKRLSNYLSVLLVGPILIVAAIGITGSLMSTSVAQKILSVKSLGTVLFLAGWLVPYILASAAFTFVYTFLPNTKVRFSAALTGGIFAGITWKITGMIFAAFVVSSAQYSAIYSGFSVLILSLIWLYWSWFILFVGAEIAYYHQYPGLLRETRKSLRLSNRTREKLALLIMFHVASDFHKGLPYRTLDTLSKKLAFPASLVREQLEMLEEKGLLARSHDEPPGYLPGRDLETISIQEILDVAGSGSFPASNALSAVPVVDQVIEQTEEALHQAVEGKTLKHLIAEAEFTIGPG